MKFKNGKFLNSNGLLVLIWIFCFAIVSIVFLVKLDDIKTNLKNTRFFERLFGTTPAFIENHVDKNEKFKEELGKTESTNTVININKIPESKDSLSENLMEIPEEESIWNKTSEFSNDELDKELTDDLKNLIDNEPSVSQIFPENTFYSESNGLIQEEYSISQKTQTELEREQAIKEIEERFVPKTVPLNVVDANKILEEDVIPSNVETSISKLWFILVDSDGQITRKQFSRKIVKSTAPLTNNIKLLLQGPNSKELDSGCMSLIPEGTRLLTAIVKDGVAYLNFSREFSNNRVGVEGYLAQLQQIVFTSTEFATVKSVQILIDGQKRDILGDGVWIGSPLSRADFK